MELSFKPIISHAKIDVSFKDNQILRKRLYRIACEEIINGEWDGCELCQWAKDAKKIIRRKK